MLEKKERNKIKIERKQVLKIQNYERILRKKEGNK
jgi:hypothetical protein